MPCYVYNCKECDKFFQVWHGMRESQKQCQLCNENDCLVRVPQMPSIKIDRTIEDERVGRVTEEYIEQNQQLLKNMKEEARKYTYED